MTDKVQTKECKKCKENLDISKFEITSQNVVRGECKDCRSKKRKAYQRKYWYNKLKARRSGLTNKQLRDIEDKHKKQKEKLRKRNIQERMKILDKKLNKLKKELNIPDISIEEINKELKTL